MPQTEKYDDDDLSEDFYLDEDDETATDDTGMDDADDTADDTDDDLDSDNLDLDPEDEPLWDEDDTDEDDTLDDDEADEDADDTVEEDDTDEGDDDYYEDDDDDPLAFLDRDEYEVTDLDDDTATDGDDTPESGQEPDDKDKVIKSLRKENAARRQKLKEAREQSVAAVEEGVNQFVNQLTSTLGIDTTDNNDVAAVTEAVAERLASAEDDALKARRELALARAATKAGADEDKLADSKTFSKQIQKLDPRADSFPSEVAKLVTAALKERPDWKLKPTLERSGGDFTGGSTLPTASDDSIEGYIKQRRERRGVDLG